MATGDSNDILQRVKQLLPRRWFSWGAPLRDALIGGISDGAAKCYDIYAYAKLQSRISTSTGPFLDIIAYDYLGNALPRGTMSDDVYRQMILFTILQPRVTRAAMIAIIERLTGHTPDIFEPWNTYDTGAYGIPTMGYGVGHGGWGNMNLPAESFIRIYRGEGSGVPNVAGWGASIGGWGAGAIEWIGTHIGLTGITDEFIYQVINQTRPTGAAVWVQFANGTIVVTPPPPSTLSLNFSNANNSQYIPLIMASSGGPVTIVNLPSLDFSDPDNSGYLALV